MATLEQNILLTMKNTSGDDVMLFPITTIDNVDGGLSDEEAASTYVSVAGNQTITGQKTFGSAPVLSNGFLMPVIQNVTFYNGTPNKIVGTLNGTQYSGNSATATKATQDGAGNVIADTYATKAEVESIATPEVYITETYNDGEGNWYRKYSDGFIEQGGIVERTGMSQILNFLVKFQTKNYLVHFTARGEATTSFYGTRYTHEFIKSTAGAAVINDTMDTDSDDPIYWAWTACGY